jgi:hypothetical protein
MCYSIFTVYELVRKIELEDVAKYEKSVIGINTMI